jgi:hypothetical protein
VNAEQLQQLQQQQQQRLDAAGISQLVRSTPSLMQLLGSADDLSVQELLDGVINVVYAGERQQKTWPKRAVANCAHCLLQACNRCQHSICCDSTLACVPM